MIIGPYIFGAQFTPADAHLFAITQWLAGDGVEIQSYPKLAQLQRLVAERPSVARMAEKGLL
jgi:glutathione S-transferase